MAAALVLVVGPIPPPVHGAARVTALVRDDVAAAGGDVLALDTSGTGSGPRYHLTRLLAHGRAVLAVLRPRRRPVSVYVGGAGGLGLWYQLPVVAAARLARRRLVFHHHSYAYLTAPDTAMRLIVRAGGRRMTHVTLGEPMSARLAERYPGAGPRLVCSNAGLLPPADTEVDRPAGEIVLAHLGNLSLHKGLDTVLATFRRLRSDGVPARLLLGGPVDPGEPARLLAEAQREFGDLVEAVGPVRPEDVAAFHARSHVFLFPSRYRHEAEPLVVLEAARCGVPGLVFDIGCVGALVADPAWAVPPGADYPAAAARLLTQLCTEDSRRRTVAHFTARRGAALAAHADLVTALQQERRG